MNLAIVRLEDHTTRWYFNATARVSGPSGALVIYRAGAVESVTRFLASKWVSYEVRKIDPTDFDHEDLAGLLVEAWVYHERKLHASSKYGKGTRPRLDLIDDTRAHRNLAADSAWFTFITNYLSRAGVFGIDDMRGAQAAGKTATTLLHMVETIQMVHGTLPTPGDTSAGVEHWSAPFMLNQAAGEVGL